MAPEKQPFYDPPPPIPSYDEAVAGSSRTPLEADPPSPAAEDDAPAQESRSLLNRSHQRSHSTSSDTNAAHPARRRNGYRPPTVESDDEDSLLSSDDEEEESTHVRREMEELEMLDPLSDRTNLSTRLRKRIPFSLPQWKWKWRWRIPKFQIRLPSRAPATESTEASTPRTPWRFPTFASQHSLLLVARVFAIALILAFVYVLFMSDLFTNMSRRLSGQVFDPESVRLYIQDSVKAEHMRDNLKHFTSYAHLAGTEGDYALAIDIKNMFHEYGMEDITVDEYNVYLNYPKPGGRAVEILGDDGKVAWAAQLEEKEVGGAKTAGRQTFAFHGHSKSGDVSGPLIYANYGTPDDFKQLADKGIKTEGAIALVRQYKGSAASKVKAAEKAGFAGCLIYSDPMEDGFLKGKVAPMGRFMPDDGVRRASVSMLDTIVGDPLTPGWESKKGLPRVDPRNSLALPKIPSLPLAWRDAKVLLQHLKGKGQEVPAEWVGGVPEVESWWTGDSSSPVVHLKNDQDEVTDKAIWNVYGRVIGVEQSSKSVIIGNHRDAWTEGATEPGSGTAIFLELVRVFGDLLDHGWRPRRTIEFMSWDAGEYNLIGSTEYVEKNLETLRESAFAYINIDAAVSGNQFTAAGSPVFTKVLKQILKRVGDPHFNETIYDRWTESSGELEVLGSDSDYVGWQDIAGTSSIDVSFTGEQGAYHSNYDTYHLMEHFIDPGFIYHRILSQVLGLLISELAERPIVAFGLADYGASLKKWTDELVAWAEKQGANKDGKNKINFEPLHHAADVAVAAIRQFGVWEIMWDENIKASSGWEPLGMSKQRMNYNERMMRFEKDLLDPEPNGGLAGRKQFKHVIFGPRLWSDDELPVFPGIRDAITAGEWENADALVAKVAGIVQHAASNLVA